MQLLARAFASLVAASVVSLAAAQDGPSFVHDARLQANGLFGSQAERCAVDWSRVYVGGPTASGAGFSGGAVLVHRETSIGVFAQEAQLISPSGNGFALFGASLACDDPYLAVGAPGEDDGALVRTGAAYVFERSGTAWILRATLRAPTPRSWGWFGDSIDLSGNVLVVGEKAGTGASTSSGAVHVFRRSGTSWNHEATLSATDGFNGAWFGWSVSVRGDMAAVGSIHAAGASAQLGAVYVFQRNAGVWGQTAKLTAPAGASANLLGHAVDLDGSRVAASACDLASTAAPGSVCTWIFAGGAWSFEQRIALPEITGSDRFGQALALSDARLFVGAPERGLGEVLDFEFDGTAWNRGPTLLPPDPAPAQRFGASISTNDFRLGVAAPGWTQLPVHGVVQTYRVFEDPLVGDVSCAAASVACPCGNTSPPIPPAGCANSTGRGARLYGLGTASVAINDLRCVAEGLVPWRVSRLVGATATLPSGTWRPIGDGALCLASPRTTFWPVWADSSGHAEWSSYFGNPFGWDPGQTWSFQVWYRDPQAPCGSGTNLSNMLTLTLVP